MKCLPLSSLAVRDALRYRAMPSEFSARMGPEMWYTPEWPSMGDRWASVLGSPPSRPIVP